MTGEFGSEVDVFGVSCMTYITGPQRGRFYIIIIIITAIAFSLGGSSPYTRTDNTNKTYIYKRNNTKTVKIIQLHVL